MSRTVKNAMEIDAEAQLETFVGDHPDWPFLKRRLMERDGSMTPGEQNALDVLRAFAHVGLVPSTLRAYESDWRIFVSWCDRFGYRWLPASSRTVILFLTSQAAHGRLPCPAEARSAMNTEFLASELQEKRDSFTNEEIEAMKVEIEKGTPDLRLSPSVLNRRLAAIRMYHLVANLASPTAGYDVKAVMDGIRRDWDKQTVKKAAATKDILEQMIDSIPTETLIGKRDRAILLLGFAGAFRRSELVSINVEHIEKGEREFIVTIYSDKNHKDTPNGTKVSILAEPGSAYCPVMALEAWLRAAGFKSGPVFCRMYRGDSFGKEVTRLKDGAVANIVKRYASLINQDPKLFGGNSLRRGFVTSAAKTDSPDALEIAKQSRHKSLNLVLEYVDEEKLLKNSTIVGLLSNGEKDPDSLA